MQSSVGEYTQDLAGYLNCPTSPSRKLLECLRKKSAIDILETRKKIAMPFVSDLIFICCPTGAYNICSCFLSKILKALGLYPIAFGPRIDSERELPFLPAEPAKLVSRKQFNSVPFINGLNSNEGGIFAAGKQNKI